MTLQQAMDLIGIAWPFDRKNYPVISDPILGHVFHGEAVRHIALHCAKDAGKMIASVEPLDHGHPTDAKLLIRSTRNMLVNSLRMADALKLDPNILVTDYLNETRGDR